MKEKNLEYFMGLEYAVLMKKVGEVCCAFIPELSLFAEGKSASEAYEKLEQEKIKYFKRVLAIDAGDTVMEPAAVRIRKRFLEDLLIFGSKTLVVAVIFGIFLSLFLPVIDVFITTRLSPIKSLESVIRQIEGKLSNMSEKDQEKAKIKLRKIAENIKPLVTEIKVIFEDDSKIVNSKKKNNEASISK